MEKEKQKAGVITSDKSNNSSGNYSSTNSNNKGETTKNVDGINLTIGDSTGKGDNGGNTAKGDQAQVIGGGTEEQTKKAFDLMNALADITVGTDYEALGEKIKKINSSYRKNLLDAKNSAISNGVTNAEKLFTQAAQTNFLSNSLDNNQKLEVDRALNNSVNDFIKSQRHNKEALAEGVSDYGELAGDVLQSPRVAAALGQQLKSHYGLGRGDWDVYETAFDNISSLTDKTNMSLLYDEEDLGKTSLLGDINDGDWGQSFVDERARKGKDAGFWDDVLFGIGVPFRAVIDSFGVVFGAVWGTIASIFGGDYAIYHSSIDSLNQLVSDTNSWESRKDDFGGGDWIVTRHDNNDGLPGGKPMIGTPGVENTQEYYAESVPQDIVNEMEASATMMDDTIDNFSKELAGSLIDTVDQKLNSPDVGSTTTDELQKNGIDTYQQLKPYETSKENDKKFKDASKQVKQVIIDEHYYEVMNYMSKELNPVGSGTSIIEETTDDFINARDSLTDLYSPLTYESPEAGFSKLFASSIPPRDAKRIYSNLITKKRDKSENDGLIII